MTWDEARAKRSNRKWVVLAVVLWLVPALVFGALAALPYAWSWIMWSGKVAAARDIRDYTEVPAGATYDEVVERLGPALYSGPGFATSEGPQAGVYYWKDDVGDIRGLVIDGRLVGSLKVGVW